MAHARQKILGVMSFAPESKNFGLWHEPEDEDVYDYTCGFPHAKSTAWLRPHRYQSVTVQVPVSGFSVLYIFFRQNFRERGKRKMIVYHELSSLEADLGISAKALYALSNSISSHYHPVSLPKKSGGERLLSVPDETLKRVQRRIAERLLSLEPISPYATAYKPASGIVKNARPHVGKKRILKLDIKGFFDSISYSAVKERAFPASRYSESNRILLTILCYYKDALPQGAPTSPVVSNIIMYDFDCTVGDFCRKTGISYTRYCDDMTFSGEITSPGELISFVKTELWKIGFILNTRKTRLVTTCRRQTVTGITVNQRLSASDEYKRELRKEMYFLKKFGVSSHLERRAACESPQAYLASLLGRINFVLQVTPSDESFRRYKTDVLNVIKSIK